MGTQSIKNDKETLIEEGYILLHRKNKEMPVVLYKVDEEHSNIINYFTLEDGKRTTPTPQSIDRELLKSMSIMDFEVNE
jgi:hypothetical protein